MTVIGVAANTGSANAQETAKTNRASAAWRRRVWRELRQGMRHLLAGTAAPDRVDGVRNERGKPRRSGTTHRARAADGLLAV
ncbi:hypothetical protein PUN4_330039 [Paraburkholderia unamae]|nr:hypothetical protein PUN4_330039 [Paraburkholderia unamae]